MPDNTTEGLGDEVPNLEPDEAAYVPFPPEDDETGVGAPVTEDPPPASSPAPQVDEESPGAVNTEGETDPPAEPEPELPEFDPKHKQAFDGLMFIGALTDEVKFAGHKFVIRTISSDDVLNIGLVTQKWNETTAAPRAFSLASVAAALVTIDGRDLPIPITNDPDDTWLLNRFNWCRTNLYPPVVDFLFEQQAALELKVQAVIDAMGEA